MKTYDLTVFIGRFQPFHNGHLKALKKALSLSNKVLVLVGSFGSPRTVKNPFTYDERRFQIRKAIEYKDGYDDVIIEPLSDILYNDDAWLASVQAIVDYHTSDIDDPKIGVIGHLKDTSSYYLKLFPQYEFIPIESAEDSVGNIINSTDIRRYMYEGYWSNIHYKTPFVKKFLETPDFNRLREEYFFIKRYKEGWKDSPYPPTFMTVDAVVTQSAHILLVTRKAQPGQGLLALPGGFVQQEETLLDGCIRELREETKLKVPDPVLRGSIKSSMVFDHPERSLRGRTITQAYHIALKPGVLPKVKGGDDAKHAAWYPIGTLRSDKMFEDHYFMIQKFLGII